MIRLGRSQLASGSAIVLARYVADDGAVGELAVVVAADLSYSGEMRKVRHLYKPFLLVF